MGHGSFVGCSECRARATSYVVGHGSFVGCRARATSYVEGHGSFVGCRARATSHVVGHGSFVGCRARATSYVVGHGSLVGRGHIVHYSNRCTPRLGVKYLKIKINTGPAVGKIFHKNICNGVP